MANWPHPTNFNKPHQPDFGMYDRETRHIIKHLERHEPLVYGYHNRLPNNLRGLYAFWLRGCCIYVGKSIDIKSRLRTHRHNTTNPDLEEYFYAFGDEIRISYVVFDDITDGLLSHMEQQVVQAMQPKANKALLG